MKIINFPNYRQYRGDCGVYAVSAVLAYYGIDTFGIDIARLSGSNHRYGTPISGLIKVARKHGLKVTKKKMSARDLKNYINKKIPVILLLQAWSGKKDFDYTPGNSDHGHYVVAIGYDDRRVYFEDPYTIYRSYLTWKQLEERWHGWNDAGAFSEGKPKKVFNLGIAINGKKPVYRREKFVPMG
jgi:predicted double-glycine peptidase